MWRNAHAKYRRNMVWVAHPDCEEQLQQLTMGDKPIWMPEGGLSDSPYQRILGRPVIYTDNCAALGSKGDLQLDDLSKYTLLKKGTARQDWSMHVEFLTDQMAFRVILRVSGTPELTQAVKIKNSETKRSAFIALGGA
jgi:HK97 family phage major capsid protein